jgi:hypothetical protein
MLIVKQPKEEPAPFVGPVNFLLLDDKLREKFESTCVKLNAMESHDVPYAIADFVRNLIHETDPAELLHFSNMLNQRALYYTLQDFIKLNLHKARVREGREGLVLGIATQFLTEAFCRFNEPDNMKHRNNRWGSRLSLDLIRVFREYEKTSGVQVWFKKPTSKNDSTK